MARFLSALKTWPAETQTNVTHFSVSEEVIDIAIFSAPEGCSDTRNLFPHTKNST